MKAVEVSQTLFLAWKTMSLNMCELKRPSLMAFEEMS